MERHAGIAAQAAIPFDPNFETRDEGLLWSCGLDDQPSFRPMTIVLRKRYGPAAAYLEERSPLGNTL
jgi:hypothetical protein